MKHRRLSLAVLVATCSFGLAAPAALACGEGIFNMGQGLRYQGYLAPRPAAVLVYDDNPIERRNVYIGLYRAGHRLTLARNPQDLAQALQHSRFDVVISSLEQVDAVTRTSAQSAPSLLPVVQRQQRNAPEVRSRFAVFLLDGASLGQYLKGIDQLVKNTGMVKDART